MSGSSGQPNLYEVPVDDGFGRRQDGQVVIFEARPEIPGPQVRGSPKDTESFDDEGPDTPAAPVAIAVKLKYLEKGHLESYFSLLGRKYNLPSIQLVARYNVHIIGRLDKSKGKVMLVVFFDYQGLVYYEFIKEGVTINKQAYKKILVRLRDAIRRKRNQLFKSKQWKLLHDYAPAH
ncbi:CLCN3 [Cordylochernes scorpioides]|uniref:CLCN3 n=1 Tax=Cordylochernes scorpioides TaxID=51811 RepID=A0ABY6KBR1_9ARAC|nr:CLCN3 [Cordylochernes scorpioides]